MHARSGAQGRGGSQGCLRGLRDWNTAIGSIQILGGIINSCKWKVVIWLLVKFEVYFDGENWCARGISVGIFTQGKTLDELTENIKEATSLHFEDVLEAGEVLKILSISEFEVQPLAKASGC